MSVARLWVVSELYHPEETSTGYFLTRIAEGLAADYPVSVLCSQPTYSARGRRAPWRETRHGVDIHRCWATTLDKDVLPLRLVNALTISLALLVTAWRRFRRGDVVLVVTNPPFLPFVIRAAAALRGARCLLLIHDVYPECLVAAGMVRREALLSRALARATRRLYRSMERIVVLGRDMKALVERKLAGRGPAIALIGHWSDVDEIRPVARDTNRLLGELGLLDKFVVQYSGNMGRTHGLETALEAARALASTTDVHFLFVGWGAKRALLEAAVRDEGLPNVTLRPIAPREELATSLGACDVTLISFVPGMAGVSVPSRLYNVLAAGRPLLAAADPESELALLVGEHEVGWVVPPGDAPRLVEAILEARSDRGRLARFGARARAAAQGRFTLNASLAGYRALLADIGFEAAGTALAPARRKACASS